VWDPNVKRWRGANGPDEGGNDANPEIVIGVSDRIEDGEVVDCAKKTRDGPE
jgi:hypothetical protein